jgi:hypothetical protein
VLVIAAAGAYALVRRDSRPARPAQATAPGLDALRSLPYAKWGDRRPVRASHGVLVHDRARASEGYNLYTNGRDQVRLMDMTGAMVRTWSVPGGRNCEYARLEDDGHLIVECADRALVKLDWQSRPVWTFKGEVHHDVAAWEGTYLVPSRGERRQHQGRRVHFDALLRISPRGALLHRWDLADQRHVLGPLHPPSLLDTPLGQDTRPAERGWRPEVGWDYHHLNAVVPLPDTSLGRRDARFRVGHVMLCLRNVNLVVIVKLPEFQVLWHWGPGVLDLPHTPSMLPDGNILIFDNGAHRRHSRVLELDPVTMRVVWSYEADPPGSFFTRYSGLSQRLPNGNTLVLESGSGRAFEVTRGREVVWEFLNPDVHARDTRPRVIYRMVRYPKPHVDRLLAAGHRVR